MARTKSAQAARSPKSQAKGKAKVEKKKTPSKSEKVLIKINSHDSIDLGSITMSTIKKFTMRVSAPRVSATVIDVVRPVIAAKVSQASELSVYVAQYYKRKTILTSDVVVGLKSIDVDIAAPLSNKVCNNGGYKTFNRKMKHYVEDRECLIIAKATFDRIVREAVKAYHNEMRLASGVSEIIQIYVEAEITQLMKNAFTVAQASGRSTVADMDVTSVLKMTLNKIL